MQQEEAKDSITHIGKRCEIKQSSWLKHYDLGVPHTLAPYPQRTLLDYLAETARQNPNHPALIFKNRRISYRELDRLSDRFASALADRGVMKGDRVALLLPNCPQFIIAEMGAWKAGAIVVPLNPIYTDHELEGLLNSCGAETIMLLDFYYDRMKAVQPRTPLQQIIATSIKEFLPSLTRIAFTMIKEKEGPRIQLQSDDAWFDRLLKEYAQSPKPQASVGPDDPAVILMSGGTTGTPKGVVGLHRCYVASGLQLQAWLKPALTEGRDAIMLPLPLFHVFGNVGAQSVSFLGRNPLSLIPNPRDLDDLLETIHQVRPAFFSGVPTLFVGLLAHPDVKAGKVGLSSIKTCFSGAAALMADTKRRFEELTGGRIIEGYSLTEALMACVINPVRGVNKIGSVGLPLPDVDVRIADAESGEEILAVGKVGEILIRAPQIMTSYWQNPAETAQALRSHDQGGAWMHSGDLGHFDDEGYLFIVDRKKDLIKVSGFQVWPREIEEVIASHPAVAEVAVAGVPDARKGEAVKAWIVWRAGMSATVEEIRAYCRERLAPYKVPTQIEFRDGLPKTAVGKVLRRMLVSEHNSGHGA